MEILLDYIIQYAPVILALLSEVSVVVAVLKKIKAYFTEAEANVKELKESAEYKDLKLQMREILNENSELKKNLNAVMVKLSHMKVQNDNNRDNQKV